MVKNYYSYNIDVLDKPSFKTKKGKGVIDNVKKFVHKHKKTLAGVTSGALGALALGALSTRGKKKKKNKSIIDVGSPPILDFSNREIEVGSPPILDFSKPYSGSGIVDDVKKFVHKHKKTLQTVAGATSGALGALALGALATKGRKKKDFPSIEKEKGFNFFDTINKDEARILPFIDEAKRQHPRRSSLIYNVPKAVPIPNIKVREDIKNPFGLEGYTLKPSPTSMKGDGKKNNLLKAVQAYKKKHGCTLKEAWTAVKSQHGSGIIDNIKKFTKKHGKRIASIAVPTLATLGATALGTHHLYKKYKKDKKDKIDEYEPLHDFELLNEDGSPKSYIQLAEEYSGHGLFDKAKLFLKKHKKKLLGATAGLAGAALTGVIGKKLFDFKKDKEEFDKAQEQAKANEYDRQLIREMAHRPPTKAELDQHLRPWWEKEHEPALPSGLNPFGGNKKLPNPNSESGLWEGDENYEKPLCRCGNDSDKILDSLGGSHLGKLIMKHPKNGYGLVSTLHQGITKGFNFLGGLTLDTLIEIAVRLVGEPSRKPITKLVKKYGWKSIAVIKKYAHKGLTAIKNALKKEMVKHGHGCCSECDSHLEKQFLGGKLNYNKFGGAFWDDVGNYVFGALHRVGDVIQGVIPGTIGKAIAFAPKSASKMAELVAPNYKFKDPYSSGDGMCGGSSTFEKIMDLIPFDLLGEVAVEKARHSMGIPSMFDRKKVKKGGKIPTTIKKIGELIPWKLLTEILAEYLNIPDYGVIPKKNRLKWDEEDEDEGGSEMRILPYYGKGKNQPTQNPLYNTNIDVMPKNNNTDYKSILLGMKGKGRTGGKSHKKKLTKKKISKILKI